MLISCNVLLTDKPLFTRLLHDVIACNIYIVIIIKQLLCTLIYLNSLSIWLLGYLLASILSNGYLIRVFCLRFMLDGVLYASKVHGYWNLDIFISNDADSH